MPQVKSERRLKVWIMDRSVVETMAHGGLYEVASDIPVDARLVDMHFSHEHNGFRFLFEHESFPEVTMGMILPTEGCFQVTHNPFPQDVRALQREVVRISHQQKTRLWDWVCDGAVGALLTAAIKYLSVIGGW